MSATVFKLKLPFFCSQEGVKGAVSRLCNQRKVLRRKLDYGASAVVVFTFRTFGDGGHVTNMSGAVGSYN